VIYIFKNTKNIKKDLLIKLKKNIFI
jgi:hypothetical protein